MVGLLEWIATATGRVTECEQMAWWLGIRGRLCDADRPASLADYTTLDEILLFDLRIKDALGGDLA